MSVRNAGAAIREARQKAGLSQEKLSDGICSVLSLSRIENGAAGVSPSTFQALMAHAGAPCEAFPIFANRADFDCFYTLKRARFYLDCWQLKEAYEELDKIENQNFAGNKYYYQEWLLLHCKLQFRSGLGNHAEIYDTLLETLRISRPSIDISDFRGLLLSLNEIELFTAIAQETLYLNKLEICLEICTQISTYLENSQINFLEKDRLLAESAIVYSKYLIATSEYDTALKVAEKYRHKMVENSDDAPLHELTFLTGLGYYYQGNLDEALIRFKTAFFSAHSIGSCYATVCRNYLLAQLTDLSLPEGLLTVPDIPLISYEIKKTIDTSDFSDGTYDLFSPDVLTIGGLIRELRVEQNISQQTLCQGLCSKSKLSKIENGTLQPDIALAQTLLQRLGISDTIFTFYGNEHEAILQNLRLELSKFPISHTEDVLKYSEEMILCSSSKDLIYIQYALYRKARCIRNAEESASTLLDALAITIPNFDFDHLHSYRLSWLELTILNNYCEVYCNYSPSKGILYLYKLLDYYTQNSLDILEEKRVLPISLYLLIRILYRQKRFLEIIETNNLLFHSSANYTLNFSGANLGHYAQALGELCNLAFVQKFGNYAYHNLLIKESNENAILLMNALALDFGITLI